ncbi:MAG: transcription initiation factor IIB family protein, partial [Nitrosopumilaceae archaeon]
MSQKCKLYDCAKVNVITDNHTGEIFCSDCGAVLEEKLDNHNDSHTHSLEEFLSQTRTGPKQTLTMHDNGLNSVIGNNRDSTGKPLTNYNKNRFRRLRIWDSRSKTKGSSQRTLVQSLTFLNGLKEKLGIPSNTVEITSSLYRKAQRQGLTRGRSSNSLMAAALYVCCRQTMTPRSLQDISEIGNISKKALQKIVRILIRELEIEMPQYNISSFIVKLSNNLGIKEKTKRYALKILEDVEKSRSSEGKNPMGQAAA